MAESILSDLHQALRRLVHDQGMISASEVTVAFEPPVRTWVAARTGPTVDFFLYDIRENTDLRKGGLETTRANGRGHTRMPPRRFDLSYLVSALSTEVEDEHAVLWRVMLTLLKHPVLPAEMLPESLTKDGLPISVKLELPDGAPKPIEIWGALDMPPRPSIGVVITVPADLEFAVDAPLVLTRSARYRRTTEPMAPEDHRFHVGGIVRGKAGVPLGGARVSLAGSTASAITDSEGKFTFASVPEGQMTLEVTYETRSRRVTFSLPSDSYEVVLD
jgi:hypothetical protein